MTENQDFHSLKRAVCRQTFFVLLAIIFVLFVIVNAIGLVAGYAFYQEFCVLHTRLDGNRFAPLQASLNEGIATKHWQNVSIQSRLGYKLQGTYLPCPVPSNKTVVFVHGIAGSRLMGLWYAPLYLGAGYNVLLYDSRASGESGGTSVSWGYYEKYDLDQWLDWLEERHPGGLLGVHGISMGAATALLHAEMNEASHRVKFYVADSAYSDLGALLTEQIDTAVRLHDPRWVKLLLAYSSIAANWQSGFRYEDVSPIRSAQKVTAPILYLHGGGDALVPPAMSEALYAATGGRKSLHIFPQDGHVMAVFNHRAEYQKLVRKFIGSIKPD